MIATQNNIWGYGEKGLEAKKAAMTMLSTKTGMYARIPLYVKQIIVLTQYVQIITL